LKRWTKDHRFSADITPGRGVEYFFLDYSLVPHIYYDPREESPPEGYGGRWFLRLLPASFDNGGLIAIIPIDNGGFLKRMTIVSPHISTTYLTIQDALLCHPLFMATYAVTHGDELSGVSKKHGGGRTNESRTRLLN
jgi:hypothetical protein